MLIFNADRARPRSDDRTFRALFVPQLSGDSRSPRPDGRISQSGYLSQPDDTYLTWVHWLLNHLEELPRVYQ